MKTIDERIVGMKFDNQQFEKGVKTTLDSMSSLKKGLNMNPEIKSFSDLDRAVKGVSFVSIADGIASISSKFEAMGIVGITVLQQITRSALTTGKNLISALTIDPIKTGLQEYETKMGAIQTILTNTASKGTTLDDVNRTLADLNTYSDKTIYNFAEMAKNIGTFTAAGIDLDVSATAIKGIANLAAGSGSNAQQASTAMYQLSQALASGSVKLMDWNSVVNAGMGGELFQNALKDTAKQMGVVVDEAIPFRETLQDGWVTAEVLTKTLAKFAADESLIKAATQVKTFTQLFDTMKESVQSGWATSWENIIGNKDQSAETLTAINDAFGQIVGTSADARNEMLSFWNVNGGRDALIQGLTNTIKGFTSVIKPISKAFREIFPATTGKRLVEITSAFEALTKKFKIGEDTADNIRRTFKGLFAVMDIGRMAIGGVAKALYSFVSWISPVGGALTGLTGNFGDFLVALRDVIKSGGLLNNFGKSVVKIFGPAATAVRNLIVSIVDGLSSFGSIDTTGLTTFSEKFKTAFAPVFAIGSIFEGAFKSIAPLLSNAASIIGEAFGKLILKIQTDLKGLNFETLISIINGALFMGILSSLKKFVSQLSEITGSGASIIGNLSSILDGVGKSLQAYQENLKAKTLLAIATSIAILAGSLIALSLVDPTKLEQSLETISVLFAQMFAASGIFGKLLSGTQLLGSIKAVITIQGLAIAILILAKAMNEIALLDWGQLAKGTVTIGALAVIVSTSANLMSKSTAGLTKAAVGIIGIAIALRILVESVSALSELNVSELAKGLVGIGVLLAELALFMNSANFGNVGVIKSVALIGMAIALNILAAAVAKFGELKAEQIGKGLVTVGLVLTELTLFMNKTGGIKNVITTALGLTILGAAMLIFGQAIASLGNLPIDTLIKGLGALALALVAIALGIQLMPGNMILTGIGLTIISVAINGLAIALKSLGTMSVSAIAKSLITLGAALVIIAGSMSLMTTGLPGAAAMLIMAAALAVFVPTLLILSSIPFEGLLVGLLGLAGAFTVIGVAGLLLTPLTPVILALSASITLLGIGLLAIGGGVMLFATGLALLANNMALFVTSLIDGSKEIVKLIPAIGEIIKSTLLVVAKIIGESGPAIITSVVILLDALIKAVEISLPKIIELVINMLLDMLAKLDEAMPEIVKRGMSIVISLLEGIAEKIPELISIATDIIVNFIDGIAKGLPRITDAGFNLIVSFIDSLALAIEKNSAKLADSFMNLAGAMIDGLVNGLLAGVNKAIDTVKNLGKGLVDSFKTVLGIHSPSTEFFDNGTAIVDGLSNGIKASKPKATKATKDLAEEVSKTIRDTSSRVSFKDGQYIADGIIIGMASKGADANEAAKLLNLAIYNGLVEEADQFTGIGDTVATDFLKGLSDKEIMEKAWASGVKISTSAYLGAEATSKEMAAAGTAAGQAYIDGLNTAAEKAAEQAQKIIQMSASGEIGESNKKRIAELKEGLRFTTQDEMAMSADEIATYWNYGAGVSGKAAVEAMRSVGENVSKGLVEGVTVGAEAVKKAIITVTSGAVDAANEDLDIHSPSRKFAEIGMYAVQGFIYGITKFGSLASAQATNIASESIEAFKSVASKISDVISNDITTSPVIRPVVDLTDVTKSEQILSNLLNKNQTIKMESAANKTSAITKSIQSDNITAEVSKQTVQEPSYSFVQNNYSPKALSRLDIYRNTKNQFSTLKGLVNG